MNEQLHFTFNDNKPFIQPYAKSYLNTYVGQSYVYKSSVEYTNSSITTLLKDPLENYETLQDVSAYFEYNSAFYTNMVYYYATILTFDYIISENDNSTISPKTKKNRFMNAAKIIKDNQVQRNFPFMLYRTLINGESYWYDLSDNENTIFKEIPSKFCRRAYIDEDNLWRYYVDFSEVDSIEMKEMPDEIQVAYKNYITNKDKKRKKKLAGSDIEIPDYLYLVTKKGFSISSRLTFEEHDYPFFANMFVDINNYENDKEYFNDYIKDDNTKLIHQKIPTDSVTGKPMMPMDEAKQYHEATKGNVPSNIGVLTNPFEVEGIAMDKSQQQTINATENSRKNAEFSSGISETMWNASTTNGLKFSIENDASKIKHLMKFFEDLMNYKIKKEKMTFKVDTQITQYNKEDIYKTRKEALGMGESYMGWISAGAYEPYDAIMIAKLEKDLGFEDLFRPKQSAYNSNMDNGSTSDGAPTKDDSQRSDSTEKSDEYK